jgi:hypothetical protein
MLGLFPRRSAPLRDRHSKNPLFDWPAFRLSSHPNPADFCDNTAQPEWTEVARVAAFGARAGYCSDAHLAPQQKGTLA